MTKFTDRRTRMVDSQIRTADVTKFPVIDAFMAVPREEFVPSGKRELAYADANVDLGGGRVLLQPRTLAKMLDILDVRQNEMVLDVGCGLGYSAALLGQLAEAVVALESDEAMAAEAEKTLAAAGADNVAVVTGPLEAGASKHGPYDVITIEGGVAALPAAIADQLKEGGRIACLRMSGGLGTVELGYKSGGRISWSYAFNAAAPVLPGFDAQPVFAL